METIKKDLEDLQMVEWFFFGGGGGEGKKYNLKMHRGSQGKKSWTRGPSPRFS